MLGEYERPDSPHTLNEALEDLAEHEKLVFSPNTVHRIDRLGRSVGAPFATRFKDLNHLGAERLRSGRDVTEHFYESAKALVSERRTFAAGIFPTLKIVDSETQNSIKITIDIARLVAQGQLRIRAVNGMHHSDGAKFEADIPQCIINSGSLLYVKKPPGEMKFVDEHFDARYSDNDNFDQGRPNGVVVIEEGTIVPFEDLQLIPSATLSLSAEEIRYGLSEKAHTWHSPDDYKTALLLMQMSAADIFAKQQSGRGALGEQATSGGQNISAHQPAEVTLRVAPRPDFATMLQELIGVLADHGLELLVEKDVSTLQNYPTYILAIAETGQYDTANDLNSHHYFELAVFEAYDIIHRKGFWQNIGK